MKIEFTKLRFKNLLAVGNHWIEIELNQEPMTLIIGLNGSGKTTIIDALTFGLFGRAFRNINKPDLVNKINGKDCVVEVEFTINQKSYKIIRGIKPNIFEIWLNGKIIDQDSRIKDYQKELERSHLKFNFKAFSQVIVLGSKTYIPFMRLVAADRRAVVEDILDIQIYSSMLEIIKQDLVECKVNITNFYNEVQLAKQKMELLESNIQENNSKTKEKLTKNLEEIAKVQLVIDQYLMKIDQEEQLIINVSKVQDSKTHIHKTKMEYINVAAKLEHDIKSTKKDIEFYTNNDNCPSCNQSIDTLFKSDTIEKRSYKLFTLETGIAKLSSEIDKINNKAKSIDTKLREIYTAQNSINEYKIQISHYNDWIRRIQKENKDIENNSFDNSKNIELCDQAKSEHEMMTNAYNALLKSKGELELAVTILKDSGIKADNIRQYIPVINNYINKYLSFMDFSINFSLDESFQEIINYRYRDVFSYENLSDGERLRLDLAILFAWRAVAKIKNSIDSNLLIMDEILDSSLDIDGVEDFFKLIKSLTGNNIFIISHKDIVVDRFQNVLHFKKSKDFSEVV